MMGAVGTSEAKLGIAGQLLFAAFGGLLGSPFFILGSALAWLVARDWVGLTFGSTAYAMALSWIVYVVVSAALAMLVSPSHTDRLSPRRAHVVEFGSCVSAAVVGFSTMADHPDRGLIVGAGVGLVLIAGYTWMASDDTLTDEEEQQAWARFNADLRQQLRRDDDEDRT